MEHAASHATTNGHPKSCYSVGQTITAVGRAVSGVNAGSYFELLEGLCVNYPDPAHSQSVSNLTTVSGKFRSRTDYILQHLPPDKYFEVTGELMDGFKRGIVGFDIHISAARDVDLEVKQVIEAEQGRCRQWQESHSAELSVRTHGGGSNPVRNTSWETPTIQCGIWAVDTEIPHSSITEWRPSSENLSQAEVDSMRISNGGRGRPILYELPDGTFAPSDCDPVLISKTEPEYTEEAHRAHISGTVIVAFVIDENGQPCDFRVVQPLGYGLDQKATEAIARWRFRPATKNGQPVKKSVTVQVAFGFL